MNAMQRFFWCARVGYFFLWVACTQVAVHAQERMTIQATVMGTSTQMGQVYQVNIHIEGLSSPEDRKALIEGFKRSGQDGLVGVLEDFKPKGRVRFASGGVGNDVKYIMELPAKSGRRFRLVTDRIIASAIKVHTALGAGLLESAYNACLHYQFSVDGLRFEHQVRLPVT